MMKLKFVMVLPALAACLWSCESADSKNPWHLLDEAKNETEQMDVLNDLSMKMQGIWRLEEDEKSELRIQGDMFKVIRNGQEVSSDRLIWHAHCSSVCSKGEDATEMLCFMLENEKGSSCYRLISLSKKEMEYGDMPPTGGKTYTYSKVGDIPKKETQNPQ